MEKNKFVYEYDDEGKRILTTFYNAKNKIQYVWDYNCKEEGALLARDRKSTR